MKTLIFILLTIPFAVFGQVHEITLDSCLATATKNWPAFKKQLSIAEQRNLISESLNKNYLPKLNFSGQATYQSEVVQFPSIPNMSDIFSEMPLDNYNVEATINQNIWDGGTINANKKNQIAANDVELKQLDIETYGLTGKINQLYTNYLFVIQNEKILKISVKELSENIKSLQTAVENGVLLSSDLDNIKAEKLKLQKELFNVYASKSQIISSLNIITSLSLDTSVQFIKPETKAKANPVRPEIALLDAQIVYSQSNIDKYKSNRLPKLTAFGKVGYGRPGFDFFNTDMHGYYLVGVKFSWNVWDWNMLKNQKQQIEINKNIIESNKAVLNKQISIEQNQYLQDINKYKKQIELDNEIEKLKESVYKAAESKFKNGTITSTEYLKIFNEWKRARMATEIDKLHLMNAKLNYEYARGIEQKTK